MAQAAERQSSRGRPQSRDQRQVAEDIIRATEDCLSAQSPANISLKKIAGLANTNQAMISYYFGDKDGLLVEVVDRHCKALKRTIGELRNRLKQGQVADPVRSVITFVITMYYERPALGQILCFELLRPGSRVRAHYEANWGQATRDLLKDLAEMSPRIDLNIEHAIEIMRSIVFFPLLMQPYGAVVGCKRGFFLDEAWADTVCGLLDDLLRIKKA